MVAMAGVSTMLALAACAGTVAAKPRTVRRPDFATCAGPEYPKAALRAGYTGAVTVVYLVTPEGTVKDSKIARSSGYASLDEAARAALAKCRFTPEGRPGDAPQWLPVQYQWVLEHPAATVTPAVPAQEHQQKGNS